MTKIKVADYLIQQLGKLGIEEIFGLPGDFNFKIVEAIENSKNVNWIGSTNELNAGYAADGYARIKGYGAIVTTYGVGELSAINAIAGCMAENIPVMKIAGVPSSKHINNKTLLHHNLANADYYTFYRVYQQVVESCAYLTKENAKDEIDRLINVMIKTRKPVYIAIPDDVCDFKIDNIGIFESPKSDEGNLKSATKKIIELISDSADPVVIADILTTRFNAVKELNTFLSKTNIPSTSFIRGMDVVKSKNYLGTYVGKKENKKCYEYVNNSDCIILSGPVISDLNTMGFDFNFDISKTINIQTDYVTINGEKFENVLIKDLLKNLSDEINYKYNKEYSNDFIYKKSPEPTEKQLTTDYIYNRLNEFIKENDIYINEVGLTSFGTMRMELPENVSVQNQMLWGSIGWATPCTLGCAMADKKRRTITITGDGAHQLTAQEISTMMRYNVKPIIFVINNSGYTVERILCENVEYNYNNISSWNYSKLPDVFKGECYCDKCITEKDFDKTLNKIEHEDRMCYIELCTDYLDIPYLARLIAKHPEQLKNNITKY